MIPNQWYVVLDSKEIKKGKLTSAKRMGKNLVFWRTSTGEVACVDHQCAHRGADLGKGVLVDDKVQCPFHGVRYDATGKAVVIPAHGKHAPVPDNFHVDSYKVVDKYGFIWLWWGEQRDSYPEILFLDDLDDSFDTLTYKDPWSVHYSRAIENQLDVPHVPFVHHNTIGRGHKTIIHGPYVESDEKRIQVWTRLELDDGTVKPIPPSEFSKDDSRAHLQFIFPNIWQNMITPKMRAMAAFVPVDDENTILYLRFYQKMVTIPGIRKLVTRLFMPFNKIVLHQDRRVVITQIPKKSSLHMNENLFRSDLPIAKYRMIRDKLQKENDKK